MDISFREIPESEIEGKEIIASGAMGDCIRLNDEQVLKLYQAPIGKEVAIEEKNKAKQAFVKGIPTAISFDLVKCGERYGVIYELLEGKSLASLMVDDPDNIDKYIDLFIDTVKHIHNTDAKEDFEDVKDYYKRMLREVDWLTHEERTILKKILEDIPNANTCVHGDPNANNMMYVNGEVQLIDMGDFAKGTPLWDFALLVQIYHKKAGEPIGKKVTKLEKEQSLHLIERFCERYFEGQKTVDELARETEIYWMFRGVYYGTYAPYPELKEETKKGLREYTFPKFFAPYRQVQMDSIYNFRDLGGFRSKDGRRIKNGMLFRCGALVNVSDDDKKKLQDLHLSKVIDLRSDFERERTPDEMIEGSSYETLEVKMNAYKSALDLIRKETEPMNLSPAERYVRMVQNGYDPSKAQMILFISDEGKESLHEFLHKVLEAENGSILWHCTQGKDRTAFLTVGLLMALGISEDAIVDDYDMTNHFVKDDIKTTLDEAKKFTDDMEVLIGVKDLVGVNADSMIEILETIKSTYQTFENYLITQVKMTEEELETLKERYLVKVWE